MSKRDKRLRTILKRMNLLGEIPSPEVARRYGIQKQVQAEIDRREAIRLAEEVEKQKAEEAERKKREAEEAKRKAEEDAKRKAEEAKKKAEAAKKRKAVAKKKAEAKKQSPEE